MAQIDRGRWAERRPESSSPESSGVPTIAFACSGEVWTIGREGAYYSLRDTKGLTYIQRLLQHPGEEFHALDLINGPGIAASSAVDSDATVAQLRERQDVTVRRISVSEVLTSAPKQSRRKLTLSNVSSRARSALAAAIDAPDPPRSGLASTLRARSRLRFRKSPNIMIRLGNYLTVLFELARSVPTWKIRNLR